jgi:hypothetical protein
VVLGAAADEERELLAGDARLSGDRLDGLLPEAAEPPADERAGVPALLLPVKQRQVAPEEPRDAVATAADVVGGDLRVGQQGLGFGVFTVLHAAQCKSFRGQSFSGDVTVELLTFYQIAPKEILVSR